jgi:hypothetical protein
MWNIAEKAKYYLSEVSVINKNKLEIGMKHFFHMDWNKIWHK